MADINMGTVYSMNQQLRMKDPNMKKDERIKAFSAFPFLNFLHTNTYYMLLCNEERDYTVFHINSDSSFEKIGTEVRETCENRGGVISLTPVDGAYEIWIRKNSEKISCYYLFPYDYGVVEG